MGEIRLTFQTRDFGAISQALIDMGISFRVEPVKGDEGEAARAPAPQPPGAETRRPAKATGKSGGKAARAKPSRKGEDRQVTAADRLRDAIARNLSSVPSAMEPETPKPPAEE
jgi:hypothetical protein